MPPDIFDTWAAQAAATAASSQEPLEPNSSVPPASAAAEVAEAADTAPCTPLPLRRALQQLVKDGVLEAASKPQWFRHIALDTAQANRLLEPLDLAVRVDDARGLAWVCVAPSYIPEDDDGQGWTHPLVRRLPLTLEQSLLLAILRREFLQREQDSGLGATVQLDVDSLLPQVEMYLGATGSDVQDRKRLTHLLDKLYEHGIVTRPDAQERITIRPLIVHLANPDNLQALLLHLQSLSNHSPESSGVVTSAQN